MTLEVNSECVFCKIVAGDLPCHRVYSDDNVFGFLDIGPVSPGHVLVIPKRHFETLVDLPAELAATMGSVLPKMAKAVIESTGADGLNVLQNNGVCAGQVVNHAHFHLVPRVADDGLGYRWRAGKYEPGEAEKLCEQISAALAL